MPVKTALDDGLALVTTTLTWPCTPHESHAPGWKWVRDWVSKTAPVAASLNVTESDRTPGAGLPKSAGKSAPRWPPPPLTFRSKENGCAGSPSYQATAARSVAGNGRWGARASVEGFSQMAVLTPEGARAA